MVGGDVPGIAVGIMVALWMEKMPSCRNGALVCQLVKENTKNISCFGNRDKLSVLWGLAEKHTSIQRTRVCYS